MSERTKLIGFVSIYQSPDGSCQLTGEKFYGNAEECDNLDPKVINGDWQRIGKIELSGEWGAVE